MDARLWRGLSAIALALSSLGASYRSPNFIVNASSQEIAEQVGKQAEAYRRDLAVEWIGKPLPNWARPCPITVQIDPRLGAGGVTSFMFDHGEVFGWQMNIQGPLDRVLDSVLPHEVTHTIFATHFRRPLPRWADEGACTTVEHDSERYKQQRLLVQFLQTGRGIPFSQMFVMTQYPRDILPLYAQGHSLSTFLVAQGGKRKFLSFIAEGLDTENWVTTTQKYYQFNSLAELQDTWLNWVRQGSPKLPEAPDALLASSNADNRPRVLRGQSPDNSSGEPVVIAPLVPVQRPARVTPPASDAPPQVAASSATPAPRSGGWLPVGASRAATAGAVAATTAAGTIAPAANNPRVLPGPTPPPVSMQVATPAVQPESPDQPSVYAVRPRPGDTLLR